MDKDFLKNTYTIISILLIAVGFGYYFKTALSVTSEENNDIKHLISDLKNSIEISMNNHAWEIKVIKEKNKIQDEKINEILSIIKEK